MASHCRIVLMGELRLEQGNHRVTHFRTRKTSELLAYLAYYRERRHAREVLIDLLWPEGTIESGRHNLSMALSSLRPLLEPPGEGMDGSVLLTDRLSVGFNPAAVTTDVSQLEDCLRDAAHAETAEAQIEALIEATHLYRAELLPGYYADWIFPEQQRLQEIFSQTLERLITLLESAGDLHRAILYALRAVSADRLREEAHQRVIRLYRDTGQPDAARRHYRELERILQEELGTVPDSTQNLVFVSPTSPRIAPSASPPLQEPAEPSLLLSAPLPKIAWERSEPADGAVPLHSRFYLERRAEEEFYSAIERQDSLILVKGAHQIGKTSLLARGLQKAREAERCVVLTHFQVFNADHFHSADTLLLAMAENIADQLDLPTSPATNWDPRRGANPNFRRFLRKEVLSQLPAPLVWGIDEIDRLFSCPFHTEIFGLFRSWYDERTLEAGGLWERLTLAIVYSTEPHLFITDLNQSPFNVGTRLTLEDFSLAQVAELNRRYGNPLKEEIARYFAVVGGQPYLVRRGLHEMATRNLSFNEFEGRTADDAWIFGEHLRRITVQIAREADLLAAVKEVLESRACTSRQSFYRLRSAGVLIGEFREKAHFRCPLYAAYLKRSL